MAEKNPMMTVAHHIDQGAVEMYTVDARLAVASHPDEWSAMPWTPDEANAARQRRKQQYDHEVEAAKAAGRPEPAPPPPGPAPLALTPDEQAAIDKFRADQAEAKKRLEAFEKEEADRKAKDEQIEADRALLKAAPPLPDPNAPRRPFGRPGEPTAKEKAAMEKAAADKAERDRVKAAKDEADRQNAAAAAVRA